MKDQINNFAQKCLTKEGGFTFIPDIYPPYLEPTYAGVRIQEILNINNKSKKPIQFAQKLQNNNGGFRRSKYMGISELEYTFKSLYIIKSMEEII